MESEGRFFLKALKQCAEPGDIDALLLACVGRRVYVNLSPSRDSWMATAIGYEKAKLLVAKLDKAGVRGGDTDVPGDGRGSYTFFRRMVADQVLRGLREGKPNNTLAAEIGITTRAVVMQKRRLREAGLIPKVSEADEYINTYFRKPNSFDPSRAQATGMIWSNPAHHDANLVAAVEDQIKRAKEEADTFDPASTQAQRIVDLIERAHGKAIREAIVTGAGYRLVGFAPATLRRSSHPFRQALDYTDSALLAIRIVCCGLGEKSVQFTIRPRRPFRETRKPNLQLREKVLLGLSTQQISEELGIPRMVVNRARFNLRQKGEISLFVPKGT